MSGDTPDEYERRYMDPGETVRFREKVVSRKAFGLSVAFAAVFGVVGLVALGAAALGVVPAAVGLGAGAPAVAFAAFMAVTGVMFSVFRAMVSDSHVHVHFGWAKRKIPMGAILSARVVPLTGLKQGKVSLGLDGVVRTWVGNSASGRGLELTYQIEGERKHVLTIGSEDPERFLRAIDHARSTAVRIEPGRVRIAGQTDDDAAAEQEAPPRVGSSATRRAGRVPSSS